MCIRDRHKDSGSFLGLGINRIAIKEEEEETIYEITLVYISERVSNFRVSIHARVEEDLQVTIEPIDAYTLQTCRWTVDHRYNLNGLSSTLREEILSFIDWKRKIKTK